MEQGKQLNILTTSLLPLLPPPYTPKRISIAGKLQTLKYKTVATQRRQYRGYLNCNSDGEKIDYAEHTNIKYSVLINFN